VSETGLQAPDRDRPSPLRRWLIRGAVVALLGVAVVPPALVVYKSRFGRHARFRKLRGAAAVFMKRDRPANAVRALEAALTIAPRSITANYELGLALLAAGERQRGRAALERAVELDPDTVPARVARGQKNAANVIGKICAIPP